MAVTFDPNITFSRANVTLTNSSLNHNYVTTAPYTRIGVTSVAIITGLASPVAWQQRIFAWDGTGVIRFMHDSSSSTAANRILFRGSPAFSEIGGTARSVAVFLYDPTLQRWVSPKVD